tara:strand:+ start:95920 stop:96900 length:981 start_codon:yes stop_codon:yes gene_type:complete
MLKIARNLIVAASLLAAGTASAEEVLRGVAALPENNVITQSFLRYVDMVNEAGKGVVSIQFVGGPEAIPPTQQDTALRNGVIDIQGGPAGYYKGVIPESDAFTGATVDAATARANGGFDLLAEVWKEKLGARLLAWNGAGTQYYVYLSQEPELTEDGSLNLEGMKLRSAGTYRDWFSSMGAENVMMKQSEVFSALERGVVDGFGWITFVSDIGVNRLIKARVGPAVWQGSPVIMMNDRRFESLSPQAQNILTDAALALEVEIAAGIKARIAQEEARLAADGVTLIEMEGEAGQNHVANAHKVVWDALAAKEPEFAAKIRPLMYPDN